MKDIKSYIIGFLTCVCMFLIMGQTKNTAKGNVWVDGEETTEWSVDGKVIVEASENGRYQISTSSSIGAGTPPWIHETILDTQTGEVIGRDSYIQKLYKKHN